jgi:two-component system cell cycle sensor histidine kinase/response regulator CckA
VSRSRKAARPKPASPALLAAALRAQSEGVFIASRRLGPDGLKIIFVNESFCAMTGHAEDEILGRPHGVFHLDKTDLDRLRHWLRKAKSRQSLVGEGYLVRANGGTFHASWSFDPLCDEHGRVTHIAAAYRDMTEKRRLQEALVHAQRLDAVGRLAGGVAHDFNNLLSIINGYSEMLAARVAANPQALREVCEIHNAGRKAAALTQQLLAFSRRQPMDSRVVNLTDLVKANAEILRRLLSDRGQLELELAEDLANVRTDPTQFQQVLLNLVLNARDALRQRGRIVITTSNHEVKPGTRNRRLNDVPAGHYVMMTVADNGTGIDVETQKHLFEPFFTTKPDGTGLGLALAYGVVQQSAGFISVKSELLVGSTFEILLPKVAQPVDPPTTFGSMAPFPTTRGSECILLVEHDEIVRKMVAGMLTSDGYRVIAAATPHEALAAARAAKRPVQLLIANTAGEGEKLARALQVTKSGLRVINLSPAETSTPFVWLPPAHQFPLPKPFALSELLQSVRRLLDAKVV